MNGRKLARDLVPGDRIIRGGQRLRIVAPPEPPVLIHAEELDDQGEVIGTVAFTAGADDDAEPEFEVEVGEVGGGDAEP